ncbi:MAG TPA: ABC transporter permease [Candidatus Acidoferrum sp.]|nr:ABC transporter permease [Candidatus Acidoferrum sp.]
MSTQLTLTAVVLGLWQYIGSTSQTEALVISTPWHVAEYLWQFASGSSAQGSWSDLSVTFQEAAGGCVLGVAVGIVLAVLVASSRWVALFATPFVAIVNALPKIALAPLFILIFGANYQSKVYFVAAAIFFLSFYNIYTGIRSIDILYLRNTRILGANRRWLIREVYIPSIVGWVAISLRLSATYAIVCAVVAEYLSANQGMGYVVYLAQGVNNSTVVIGGILIVSFTALIIDRIIVRTQRHFTSWRLR